jgi:uncharacterized membrane protein YgcG
MKKTASRVEAVFICTPKWSGQRGRFPVGIVRHPIRAPANLACMDRPEDNAMHTSILTAATVVCLLGCSTPQERAAAQQAEMDRMIGEFGPACYQLGYPAQSDQWRNCVVQLAARNGAQRGGVSTSFFGSWGSFGRGSGSSVGAGVTLGR